MAFMKTRFAITNTMLTRVAVAEVLNVWPNCQRQALEDNIKCFVEFDPASASTHFLLRYFGSECRWDIAGNALYAPLDDIIVPFIHPAIVNATRNANA
jgi:hypothetical protein